MISALLYFIFSETKSFHCCSTHKKQPSNSWGLCLMANPNHILGGIFGHVSLKTPLLKKITKIQPKLRKEVSSSIGEYYYCYWLNMPLPPNTIFSNCRRNTGLSNLVHDHASFLQGFSLFSMY